MPKYRGGNGPPVQGSALGKEGRKYGVGMGKNCPFMRETTALKPTMDGVGMGENCPFMHGTTALKPTMDGVGMGENAFLCTKKGYYTPLIIGRRCREVGGKTPPHYPIRPHVFQKQKK